jgi:DnaK suppressor protein
VDAERTEFFKKLLEERLSAMLRDAGDSIGKLTDEREAYADTLDIATMESTRDFSLRLQDRERRLVHKIKAALQRIEDGEYGVCVACGDDIGEKRLMARPVATHCIDCKTEAEQQERREF